MLTTKNRLWFLIIPPAAFLLKDVIATIAVLSREPAISSKAAHYYAIAMLPGTLISPESAMLLNLIIGSLIGGILYLTMGRKQHHE
jgi:hypothetical protein